MKTTTIIIRMLFGTLLLIGSVVYFLKLAPEPDLTGDMKVFNDGLTTAIYLMPLVKSIELVCGLAFLFNRFIPLATIMIFPIAVNIFCVHLFLAPEGLPVAVFVMFSTLFLAVRHQECYRTLFTFKPSATIINK